MGSLDCPESGWRSFWLLPTMQRNNWRWKKIFRDCINIPIGYLFVGHWTVPERLSHTKSEGLARRIGIVGFVYQFLTGIGLKGALWSHWWAFKECEGLCGLLPGSMTWTIKWWWWLRPGIIPLGLCTGLFPENNIIPLFTYVFRRIVSMPCGRLNRWILLLWEIGRYRKRKRLFRCYLPVEYYLWIQISFIRKEERKRCPARWNGGRQYFLPLPRSDGFRIIIFSGCRKEQGRSPPGEANKRFYRRWSLRK